MDHRSEARTFLVGPRLGFPPPSLLAVLHAFFIYRPDLRIAALPFGHRFISEIRQIRDAHLAREEATHREIAETSKESRPPAIRRGGTCRPGDAVQNLRLLLRPGGGEILLEQAHRFC